MQNNSNTFKTKSKEMPGCREKKSSELTLTHLLQCTNTGKINTYRIATVLTATLKTDIISKKGACRNIIYFVALNITVHFLIILKTNEMPIDI